MAGPYVGCAFQDGLKPCVIGVGKGRWLQAGFFGLSIFSRYMLRLARKRWLFRAFRKRRELRAVADRSATLSSDAILVFSTLRNERVRLPFFLRYYRSLGISHFLIVDNNSDDGSREYLAARALRSQYAAHTIRPFLPLGIEKLLVTFFNVLIRNSKFRSIS